MGELTALTYVLTVGNKQRFQRSRYVGCYLGLRPRRSQSGGLDPQLSDALELAYQRLRDARAQVATFTARYDRRHVLIGLTTVTILSLVLIALAPNSLTLMVARAMLGVLIGGFWPLATATVMRLVPEAMIPKALGAVYMGNALAIAFAASIGSYLGWIIG